jgi:Ca2+-binding EF-hand superfamily protein
MGCCAVESKRTKLTKEEAEQRQQQREAEIKNDINHMFNQFDTTRCGSLDTAQLRQMVRQLSRERGQPLSEEEAQKYVAHIQQRTGTQETGRITKEQLFDFYLQEI